MAVYCAPKQPYTTLEEWRDASCCINGFDFWQLDCHGDCSRITTQTITDPQSGVIGRDQVRKAIKEAEQIFRDRLGYPVVPTWITETIDLKNCNGRIKLSQKHVKHVGQPVLVSLGSHAVEYFSQRHGDCLDEFEVQIDIAELTEEQEIALLAASEDDICAMLPASEYSRKERKDREELRPLCIEKDANTLTISGDAWMLVKPSLLNKTHRSLDDYLISSSDASSFVSEIEIYIKTVDACTGLTGLAPMRKCGCEQPECNQCWQEIPLVACIDDYTNSIVRVMPRDVGCRCVLPEKVCITYLAYDCTRDWSHDIFALSVAELCHEICGCSSHCIGKWQADYSEVRDDGAVARQATRSQIGNPLGSLHGHQKAWNAIKQYKCKGAIRI